MGIVEFILDVVKGSSEAEIRRCLAKATVIVYSDDVVFVADSLYVYYLGARSTRTKAFRDIYKKHANSAIGKYLYAKDPSTYGNSVKLINEDTCLYQYTGNANGI